MQYVKESVIPNFIAMLFWCIVIAGGITLTGCQTASNALGAAGALRDSAARTETDAHVRGLCSSNFNVIREKFGKNDQDWNAILNICESGQNSTDRVAP